MSVLVGNKCVCVCVCDSVLSHIERRFHGVIEMAYLDAVLCMACCAADLFGVAFFFSRSRFQLNFSKSLLCPVSRLIYSGIDIGLNAACTHVAPDALRQLRAALSVFAGDRFCSASALQVI